MFHRLKKDLTNDSQLLVLDPEKRIPLDDIQRHPWIVKHCMKDVKRSSGSSKEGKA